MSDSSQSEHLKMFRRTMHAAGNSRRGTKAGDLRRGLSRAIKLVPADALPYIVSSLAKQNIYLNAFCGPPFPKNFAEFQSGAPLVTLDSEREFVWTGAILKLFTSQLSRFVEQKAVFDRSYLLGQYDAAAAILDEIEQELGISIWLVSSRLQLLQTHHSLAVQKNYLEQLLGQSTYPVIPAFISYYASMRSEENVTLLSLQAEVQELINRPGLGDYIRYQVLPIDPTAIITPSAVISWEEPHPIVDRYLALIAMAQLEFIRNPQDQRSPALRALQMIESVGDPTIQKVICAASRLPFEHHDIQVLPAIDYYTSGDYNSALIAIEAHQGSGPTAPDLVELGVRANLLNMGSLPDTGSNSLLDKIQQHMAEALSFSGNYTRSIQSLQKAILTCPNSKISIYIATFLLRLHDNEFLKKPTELDYLSAINGSSSNPRNAYLISVLTENSSYFEGLLKHYPFSVALTLRNSFGKSYAASDEQLLTLEMPAYRKSLYRGHLAMQVAKFQVATAFYQEAREDAPSFMLDVATKSLFDARLALDQIDQCVILLCDHYLNRPNTYRLFPLDYLVKKAVRDQEKDYGILLPIVLHIAARHVHHRWERDLSDAYENFMENLQCDRPTDLAFKKDIIEQKRLIYFLRYICVPRILDDTIAFDSIEDIEHERIAICQFLIELDPENGQLYSEEIKDITRDTEVFTLARSMDETRIYVNDSGIRDACEERLRPSFARYQDFLQNPSLRYQSDKISKHIQKLLGEQGSGLVRDLKLPATELEALFNNMLTDFVNEFASNPAYGLDTHLSTSIRHGAFEGHLRSPISSHDLFATKDTSGEYITPSRWRKYEAALKPSEYHLLKRYLVRFSERVDHLISMYKVEKLHIRTVDIRHQGLFNFTTEFDECEILRETIGTSTTYNEFVDRMLAFSWSKIDSSLAQIRRELNEDLLVQINSSFSSLIASVDTINQGGQLAELMEAAIKARNDFHVALTNVSSWFRRPADIEREPFDFEVAVGVALKQIGNCYVRRPLRLEQCINVPFRISGFCLDGFVEILFIFFQNVVLKSGIKEEVTTAKICAFCSHSDLIIDISNPLAPSIDLQDLHLIAEEAVEKYRQDTALRMARVEGGSGLSKIWRILQFDVKADHYLDLSVGDDRTFRAVLRLKADPVKAC